MRACVRVCVRACVCVCLCACVCVCVCVLTRKIFITTQLFMFCFQFKSYVQHQSII